LSSVIGIVATVVAEMRVVTVVKLSLGVDPDGN